MKLKMKLKAPTVDMEPCHWKENGEIRLRVTGLNKYDYDRFEKAINDIIKAAAKEKSDENS